MSNSWLGWFFKGLIKQELRKFSTFTMQSEVWRSGGSVLNVCFRAADKQANFVLLLGLPLDRSLVFL